MRTVDVSYKLQTLREAVAYGKIRLSKECIKKIKDKELPKGDCIEASKLAGLYGAKNTPMLLPFCHPIGFDHVQIEVSIGDGFIEVTAKVRGIARTGYEMEALTAVSVALLNIYDMCKGFDSNMVIEQIKLISKKGGKSQYFETLEGIKVAVITVSDRASRSIYEDKSGKLAVEKLKELSADVVLYKVVPDEREEIQKAIKEAISKNAQIIVTSGGTGLGPKDITPEVISEMALKEVKGFGEAMRILGSQYTPKALVSRASGYILPGGIVVLVLPGSKGAVKDYLELLGGLLKHALDMAKGKGH
ncbi:MAG TPA: bifunctional molybdenum cofactor biosynthesis protein MoaC/MoaB [Aquifex aeolicus]|uniref:Bifunctional molybdenum cofactor biosynthesis protein MoaC/MoaB n=1 Tax=Aquifex aeolicus TaxID=63363 RepID=A0A9D0YMN4_AQUAO|nr:bifunctional molybdenum cofactor biosynthesis protein MoaC/MoaB [Aquificales bacterium]HIP97770.1 bifunctional molybdenum cofactor biosynthesis protein MoaC/MoaB [Aquifex aeolicus]HIQ26492.1 bifunctional molybdenum cofactor biosynthesis protein MoaC/MoaB [Aquifex aeolicus]